MNAVVLGIDTSCYTTSAAAAAHGGFSSARRLLDVPPGDRGLRQSEAFFQHVQRLPALIEEALSGRDVAAVCASVRPRDAEGSYMPVFTAGAQFGAAIAAALRVPFLQTTHQQGHIAAALVDSGLAQERFLCLHLSGGTTEALLVEGNELRVTLVGGSADLHAGQLVDRVGVALGLPFPAGPHLEALATEGTDRGRLGASLEKDDLCMHFSGAEAAAHRLIAAGERPADVAAEVFSCLCRTTARFIAAASKRAQAQDVLVAGGVSSSRLLRAALPERLSRLGCTARVFFARPDLAADNAVGVALIGRQKMRL